MKNRDTQRQVNEKGKEIESKSNNPEESKDLKIILEELRTNKEKLKEMETRYQGEMQRSQMIQSKIAELEKTAKELGVDLAAINQPKAAKGKTEGEAKANSNTNPKNKEITAIRDVITELEKNKQSIIAQAKKKCSEIEESKIAIAEEVNKLSKQVKDKDHECKLKEYEIKDLKRNLRNLQMKLNSAPDIHIESDKPPPEITKSPKKHNKKSQDSVEEDKPREEMPKPRHLSMHEEEKSLKESF